MDEYMFPIKSENIGITQKDGLNEASEKKF
jgi:hypothetical protein